MTQPRIAILHHDRSPFITGLATELRRALDPGTAPPADAILREVDACVALDARGLDRAIDEDALLRIAFVTSLDPDWDDVLEEAHAAIVPHPGFVAPLIAMGCPRSRIRVGSFVAVPGHAGDRAAARNALSLPGDLQLVLVPGEVIGDDLTGLLLQLSLARPPVRFLFDVGRDAALSGALRRRATMPAFMFAEGPTIGGSAISELAWRAADRVIARLEGLELARAMSTGVPLILTPPRATDSSAGEALATDGIAVVASTDVTVSVAIDAACTHVELDRARRAIAGLELDKGAARNAALIRDIIATARGERDEAGLPTGLEPIGPAPEAARAPAPPKVDPEVEIDRELKALKDRISTPG